MSQAPKYISEIVAFAEPTSDPLPHVNEASESLLARGYEPLMCMPVGDDPYLVEAVVIVGRLKSAS